MADVTNFPDEEDEGPEATVIDFPFSLRTTDTDVVPGSVVVIDEQNEGRTEGETQGSNEEDDDEEDETTEQEGMPSWIETLGLTAVYNMPKTYPRLHAVVVGVIVPLIFLVGAAIFFGQGIVWAESAPELNRNDDAMMQASLAERLQFVLNEYAQKSFLFCISAREDRRSEALFLDSFVNSTDRLLNDTTSVFPIFDDSAYLDLMRSEFDAVVEQSADLRAVLDGNVDTQDVVDCDEFAQKVSMQVVRVAPMLDKLSNPPLTFHWNQCLRSGSVPGFPNRYHPDAQRAYYKETWTADRDRQYQTLADGEDTLSAFVIESFLEASMFATGSDVCEYNSMGASWFWFSVMTSIGYGDVVPQTDMGKIFVYTAGFASILMFFGVLSSAGKISTLLMDELLHQMSFESLASASVGFVYWCGLYFAWMLLVGRYYAEWNDSNLNISVDGLEGFWFAFNSLTTLGFGDLSVQVEVFQLKDMIVYSLLFLVGFFCISMGYSKLLQMITVGENETEQTLKGRLAATSMTKATDNSTLADQPEPPSESPDQERDIATMAGTAVNTVRLDTNSVMTPMETVFTREEKPSPVGPPDTSADNG